MLNVSSPDRKAQRVKKKSGSVEAEGTYHEVSRARITSFMHIQFLQRKIMNEARVGAEGKRVSQFEAPTNTPRFLSI